MLRIFDQDEPRNEKEREASERARLSRLQALLGSGPKGGRSSQELIAEKPDQESQPTPGPDQGVIGKAVPGVWSSPASASQQAEGVDRIARQFTEAFLKSVKAAMEEIHGLVAQDRATIELLARNHKELLERVQRLEERVAELAGLGALNVTLEQLARRLDAQAEVIRGLHAGLMARDEKLQRLVAALQGLQSLVGVARTEAPVAIPEEL